MILESEVLWALGWTVLSYKFKDKFGGRVLFFTCWKWLLASLGSHIKPYLQAFTSIAQHLWASGYLHLPSAWYWQAAMKSWWLEGWLLGALHAIFQKCKWNTDLKKKKLKNQTLKKLALICIAKLKVLQNELISLTCLITRSYHWFN